MTGEICPKMGCNPFLQLGTEEKHKKDIFKFR